MFHDCKWNFILDISFLIWHILFGLSYPRWHTFRDLVYILNKLLGLTLNNMHLSFLTVTTVSGIYFKTSITFKSYFIYWASRPFLFVFFEPYLIMCLCVLQLKVTLIHMISPCKISHVLGTQEKWLFLHHMYKIHESTKTQLILIEMH